MVELRARDVRALYRFLHGGGEIRDTASLAEHILEGLPRLVDCDSVGYNEVDLVRQRVAITLRPEGVLTAAVDAAFQAYADQHPVIAYQARTGDTRSMAISDFLSRRQFARLDIYQHGFKPMGVDQVIALGLPTSLPVLIGIALARAGRAFTARERAVLEFVRPHLAQMYRAVTAELEVARLRAAVEAGERVGVGVALIRRDGAIDLLSEQAQRAFREGLGVMLAVGTPLPASLREWIDGVRAGRAAPGFRLGDAGRLRFIAARRPADCDALVVSGAGPLPSRDALRALGLTEREADVLAWVSRGKTNGEIAAILGAAPRTIEKHLERVYEKLGVATRTAAVACALEWTGS